MCHPAQRQCCETGEKEVSDQQIAVLRDVLRLTANRSSKQDLPTPESPISRSCAEPMHQVRNRNYAACKVHTMKSKSVLVLTLKR